MLFHANVPGSYWVDAFSSATYIINRLPTKILGDKSPFEILFSHPPNYGIFRTYCCQVFPYLRDYSPHKLAPRSLPCIFIGYSSQHKGYRCLDPVTSWVYITRHARFDEETFPFSGMRPPTNLSYLPLTTFLDDLPISVPQSGQLHVPCSPTSSAGLNQKSGQPPVCSSCINDVVFSTLPSGSLSQPSSMPDMGQSANMHLTEATVGPDVVPSPSHVGLDVVSSPSHAIQLDTIPPVGLDQSATGSSSIHPMITRAKAGIFKPRHRADLTHLQSHNLYSALFARHEPKGYKSAAKNPKWMLAMHEEMCALSRNQTWKLVQRPKNANVVGSKWVFRTKYNTDGSVERFKARLVAQGFTQMPGIDYFHTFSPVVKASTVRIVLSLAVIHNWRLHQLDVKNAFLNGNLSETVFMEQPPGFVDPKFPDHVCHLKKALYGLKQAPRSWFQRLSSFLVTNGFTCSRADTSLFIFKQGSSIMYLLVYVDDLILTGNQEHIIHSFVSRLHLEFAIKDLGDLSYFLGLEVIYTHEGLFLSHSKYAHDILEQAQMLDSKPVHTPLAPHETFSSTGTPFPDSTLYRSLVGALQYLTITRPDLSYSVNQVSQFLHAPTVAHFQCVKRILRYVKGTLSFGLTFKKPSSTFLLGYSDADWARCVETRRSTYGYSIFLGGNLVSWSAKKQPTVSRSSCESEYRAMANTAAEIVWITHLLHELHALPRDRPTLLCDNRSALFLSQNPVSHKRAKHIDLDYHFIRELVSSGKLYTKFVPTKLQVADIFTKSLPRTQFEFFRNMLRLGPPTFRLRGDIRNKIGK